jgi:two-component system response regulator HydG
VTIFLPPLTERRGDILLLADHFLKHFAAEFKRPVPAVTRRVQQALLAFAWPGNIRELRNVIQGMLVLDTDGRLDLDDLPDELAQLGQETETTGGGHGGADSLIGKPLTEVEKFYIERALDLSGGKRDEAAKMLEIGERTLYRKIKEYDIRT